MHIEESLELSFIWCGNDVVYRVSARLRLLILLDTSKCIQMTWHSVMHDFVCNGMVCSNMPFVDS